MSNAVATKSTLYAVKGGTSQPKGKWYTEDEIDNLIIDEYKKFKASLDREERDFFNHNLNMAKSGCEELFFSLKTLSKIDCKKIHLRVTSKQSFDAIVEIPFKNYISDGFNIAFNKSQEIANRLNNSKFFIEYTFMPSSRSINRDLLISDGYFQTYKPKNVNKTSTRKA